MLEIVASFGFGVGQQVLIHEVRIADALPVQRCEFVTQLRQRTAPHPTHCMASQLGRRQSCASALALLQAQQRRGAAIAAAYEIALGETKELIVALDCVQLDELASLDEILVAQDLADRTAAMLTRLIESTGRNRYPPTDLDPGEDS